MRKATVAERYFGVIGAEIFRVINLRSYYAAKMYVRNC